MTLDVTLATGTQTFMKLRQWSIPSASQAKARDFRVRESATRPITIEISFSYFVTNINYVPFLLTYCLILLCEYFEVVNGS